MELSSVSPPAASRTEGADLCEIDVTNVAINSVTLLICLCGLVGNGAVLRLLTLQGPVARIFDLGVADFLFLLFVLPSALLFLLEDVSCSPVMPQVYVSFLFQLSMVSCYWTLFRLTRIGAISNMRKLCQLCRCDPSLRVLWVVDSVQYWAFFAFFTAIPTVTFLCPAHEQEQCRVALTYVFTVTLLIFAAPMIISHTIDIVKAKFGSQQQQPKRRNIVIFVTVLLALLLNPWNFLQQLGYTGVSSQVVFLLACIHSSIKPFIYFLAGMYKRPCTKESLRESLQKVFEEPEGNTPRSRFVAKDLVTLSPLIPSPALLKDAGTMTEGFLESPDQ